MNRPIPMAPWLRACRENFGPAPRKTSWLKRGFLRQGPPDWMREAPDDLLWQLFDERDALLRQGEVVWGHLIQANMLLFRPGPEDHPAEILFSTDPFFENQPRLLEQFGHQFFALKGTQPDDPELRKIADDLADEMERTLSAPLPIQVTQGRRLIRSSIMVHRAHLPNRVLSNGLFPVICAPDALKTVMILPSLFWPEEMQRLWKLV